MTAQEDLAAYIQQQIPNMIEGISIFAGVEPDATHDPCITLRNTGDEPSVYTYGQRTRAIANPHVMVWARSKVYNSANNLAATLYDLLQQTNININGTFYQMVRPMSEPQPWGPDPNNRQQIGFIVRTSHA